MAKPKPVGVCKLTGDSGQFVRSHLIPDALTRLSKTGNKYIETGVGLPVTRPSSSWYDERLVTRRGEDVLEDIDTQGIEILRRHSLVWSGWKGTPQFNDVVTGPDLWPVRLVSFGGEDEHRLRLFFISLLWRAAATDRPQFESVRLPDDILLDLKDRIVRRDAGRAADYPIQLFQLTSLGPLHNRSPIAEEKTLPGHATPVRYVRFYFDGLTTHVHLPRQTLPDEYLLTCLGVHEATIVFAYDFEESRTAADMATVAASHLAGRGK